MSSLMFASAEALAEMEVEFPNLFNGMVISYRRGFSLFGLNIYWYGVLIFIGVILAYFYAMHRATRDFGLVKDRVFDVAFVCIIVGFVVARVYYCVFTELKNPGTYNFITTFTKIRDGGLAIYGGIIGSVLIGILMCRLRKVNFFAMADLASLGFLIGQAVGRWGNFINQEAYGAACSSDWLFAMGGNVIRSDPKIPAGSFVHPCFLYESAWCVLGFVLLHIYSKKLRTFDGELALLYVAWYGFGRAFIEQLRTDSLYAGPLKVSQWVGAVTFVAAMITLVIAKIKTSKSGRPLYVNTEASKELIEGDLQAELERKAKKEKKAESIIADDEADDETADETDGEANEEHGGDSEEESAEEESADEETDQGEDKENDNGSEDN